MTIAFDASSRASSDGTSALTIAHTCSGENRALVVSADCPNSTNYLATATVTYAGQSMGAPIVASAGGGEGSLFLYTWVLANPAPGTNNIVVTPSWSAYLDVVATSFTGVDQATPVESSAAYNNSYGVSPTSTAIAVSTGGVAVDAFAERVLTGSLAPDASQTLSGVVTANSVSRLGASYKTEATVMAWAFTALQPIVKTTIVALKAAAGGANATGTGALASITLTAPTGSATGTSSATNGTGTGTLQSIILTAPAGTATGTSAGSGTITTPVMKNNTGTVLANETGVIVNVYNASTGVLIVQKTGQTSNASGIVTISDALIVPATTYAYEVVLTGSRRRLPTASAA